MEILNKSTINFDCSLNYYDVVYLKY
jgi:hypothetical protein